MAMTKVKNLQMWCKKMTEGYRDVSVVDMTKSWKDGLAFCAVIHKFRPDLIDFDALSKENIFENNELAFSVAERELDIPALLEAPDMVAMKVPDRLSVVTYVSQYYNYFCNKPQLGGPGVKKTSGIKRHPDDESPGPEAKRLTLNQPKHLKTPAKERQVSMGDKCTICHEKVYLLERHVEDNKLYHRTCFRRSHLSPTSKIYDRPSIIVPSGKKESEKPMEVDSQQDFWSRRAEAKKKENLESKVDRGKNVNGIASKADSKAFGEKDINSLSLNLKINSVVKDTGKKDSGSDTPSWKKTKPADLNLSNIHGNKGSDSNSKESHVKSGPSSAAKLKQFLNSDSDIKHLENDQKSDILSKTERHPKPTPRHGIHHENKDKSRDKHAEKVKGKHASSGIEKMDTSVNSLDIDTNKSRPVPVPRAGDRKNKDKNIEMNQGKHLHGRVKSPVSLSPTDLSPGSGSPPPLPSTAPPPIKTVLGSPKSPTGKISHIPKEEHGAAVLSQSHTSKDLKFSKSSSPVAKKRIGQVDVKSQNKMNTKSDINVPPAKPKRMSELNVDNNVSQMDVDEPPTAYLVRPPDPVHDKQMVGSLLKTLANVRKTKPPDQIQSSYLPNNQADVSKSGDISKTVLTNKGAIDGHKLGDVSKPFSSNKGAVDYNKSDKGLLSKHTKGASEISTFDEVTIRNKGTNIRKDNLRFVSNKLSVFSDDTGATKNQKSKSQFMISQGDEIRNSNEGIEAPSWKRKVEQKRPKSADLLSLEEKKDMSQKTEWQIEAEKRKAALDEKLKSRPKSVETVLDKKQENLSKPKFKTEIEENKFKPDKKVPARPKSADLLAMDVDKKPDWQIEAEKRKAARGGGYVDPEKPHTNVQRDKHDVKPSKQLSPVIPERPVSSAGRKSPVSNLKTKDVDETKNVNIQKTAKKSVTDDKVMENHVTPKRRVLPTPPKEDTKPSEKKKISVGINFDFELDKNDKPHKPLPVRSPVSPRSPHGFHHTPPPRPPPPRKEADRQRLSPLEIQEQLVDIDEKLTKLEVRGRQLEDSIRKAQEDTEDEIQMIEWFKLVNEKNELVRKEADLIYASRQQELEDEQHDIDQRVRHLMSIPDSEKTDEERKEEEFLVQKLVDTVNQRSIIVDSQDEDRIRYEQEDKEIAEVLAMKGFLKDSSTGDLKKKKKKDKK